MTSIDIQITKYCSDMVAEVFRPAVAEYAKALSSKYGIKHDEAMIIWDNMNPEGFSISAIKSGAKDEKSGVKKARKKRTTPAKASAWREYSNQNRPSVKAELAAEGLEGKELFGATAKKLGSNWKARSDDEKKPYQEQADKKNTESSSEDENSCSFTYKRGQKAGEECGKTCSDKDMCSQHDAQSKMKMKKISKKQKKIVNDSDGAGEGSDEKKVIKKASVQKRTPISDSEDEELSEEE